MAHNVAPDSERQALLNRVLSSSHFAHATSLKRILQFLCDRSRSPASPPPKEYEIAVNAMGRPETFDPRTDPIVRVSVVSIRERLLAYFATEGRRERFRLVVPRGQYRVVFSEAEPPVEAPDPMRLPPALAWFWKPFFRGNCANVILYTEPLFFRDGQGHYIRDLYINEPVEDPAKFGPHFTKRFTGHLTPSYHYLSAGEVHCMLSITRMFHQFHRPIDTRNARVSSWGDLNHTNLVLLGSPRTNSFLRHFQGGGCFVVGASSIENTSPQPGEEPVYEATRYRDGQLPRMTDYAVVTVRPGLMPGVAVVSIAANHGRAIEGAGNFLILENKVAEMIEHMELTGGGEAPAHFQWLMRVECIDLDDEIVSVECEAFRILDPA